MNRFKDEVKNMNMELGDIQFRDPDEDAQIIFNTIVDNAKLEAAKQARKEGRNQGLTEGEQQAKLDIAKKLKESNVDIDIIVNTTGISIDEINKL